MVVESHHDSDDTKGRPDCVMADKETEKECGVVSPLPSIYYTCNSTHWG